MATKRHFLDLDTVAASDIRAILDNSAERKKGRAGLGQAEPDADKPLKGRLLAMLFEKPSTRTRVSFDVAMRQLGGETLLLNGGDTQLGRGETIADTARVLSRYVDAIMIRTTNHAKLIELAEYATVPVINGLTDRSHPCQIMADVMTFEEHKGPIKGRRIGIDAIGAVDRFKRIGRELDLRTLRHCPVERLL
jgi:ornithine carbamoyltransferase